MSTSNYWWYAAAAGLGIALMRRYIAGGVCRSLRLMNGKTVVITGASGGIGKATALELALRHARVVLACRDLEKGRLAIEEIRKRTDHGELVLKHLDLASLNSVRKFAEEITRDEKQIDVLINNAGVFMCPFMQTADGFELQFGVNHLGHFLLTNLLLDKLKASVPSRIVMVTSKLLKRGAIDFNNLNGEVTYDKKCAYYNSKLASALFARQLSRRLEGSKVDVYCLHPGVVHTDLARYVITSKWLQVMVPLGMCLFCKTPYQGAQTSLYCAISPELQGVSGRYYGDCEEKPYPPVALDDGVAKKLWEVSEKLTGLV